MLDDFYGVRVEAHARLPQEVNEAPGFGNLQPEGQGSHLPRNVEGDFEHAIDVRVALVKPELTRRETLFRVVSKEGEPLPHEVEEDLGEGLVGG